MKLLMKAFKDMKLFGKLVALVSIVHHAALCMLEVLDTVVFNLNVPCKHASV